MASGVRRPRLSVTGHRRHAGGLESAFVPVPQQPLLADRAEFESAVRFQTPRHYTEDRDEHKDRTRDGEGERADHSVITIRSSRHSRKGRH